MALQTIAGKDCAAEFDKIFSAAHARCLASTGSKDEPHLVLHLISDQTVQALNKVCPSLYDGSHGKVSFRAAFLHHSPLARFSYGGSKPCRRELADGMFVLHETEPDTAGVHTVVRRSACLLMFKTSEAKIPRTLSFDPAGSTPPKGTNQQQFYLFNRWPQFSLETGADASPNILGKFDLRPSGGTLSSGTPQSVAHDIGQFAVVWKSSTKPSSTWKTGNQTVHWLAAEPCPKLPLNPQDASLGKLLEKFISGNAGIGRSFAPQPPTQMGWDGLMGTLLGYPVTGPAAAGSPPSNVSGHLEGKTWVGQPRDVNPARLGFMARSGQPLGMDWIESVDAAFATYTQHAPEFQGPVRRLFRHHHAWMDYHASRIFKDPAAPEGPRNKEAGFPVLIATVSRFRPNEEGRESLRMTPNERERAVRDALGALRRLTGGFP